MRWTTHTKLSYLEAVRSHLVPPAPKTRATVTEGGAGGGVPHPPMYHISRGRLSGNGGRGEGLAASGIVITEFDILLPI